MIKSSLGTVLFKDIVKHQIVRFAQKSKFVIDAWKAISCRRTIAIRRI